jgi:hypothetical protein
VARQLKAMGFAAKALKGGFHAWRALYPIAPKEEPSLSVA